MDAVGTTITRDLGAAQLQELPASPASAAPSKENDWIPVKGELVETGQFAFTVTHGPLAGIPLSVAVHGPEAVLWLTRNERGEMFMRPWEAKGPEDVPRGAMVIGSYRPALLAGAPQGHEGLQSQTPTSLVIESLRPDYDHISRASKLRIALMFAHRPRDRKQIVA